MNVASRPVPLRALVVDDEPLALRRLDGALGEIGVVDVVVSTTSARRAVDLIRRLKPDLVFLDIAMPGLNGFEVVGQLDGETPPAIVFVTAYDAHAVNAFGIDAADYLLKPVAPDRLRQAVSRAGKWLATRRGRGRSDGADERRASSGRPDDDSLWVYRHRQLVRVPIDEISWIEAQGDYVMVHAPGGGGLLRTALSALEDSLDPQRFIRVHRSAMCRRSAIAGFRREPTGAYTATLADGTRVPVGRTYRDGLMALVKGTRA
jgi:two-component system response regulator AlgR